MGFHAIRGRRSEGSPSGRAAPVFTPIAAILFWQQPQTGAQPLRRHSDVLLTTQLFVAMHESPVV